MLSTSRSGPGRVALGLAAFLTLLALIWAGNFLVSQIARFGHVALDHDEGEHATPVVQIAGAIQSGDVGGFFGTTLNQKFYPFLYSWFAAPVVMAFGPTAVTLRTFSAILLLLSVGLAWYIAVDLAPAQKWLAGLIAAALMLTSTPLLIFSSHIYVDTLGLLFTLIALFVYTHALRLELSRARASRPAGAPTESMQPRAAKSLVVVLRDNLWWIVAGFLIGLAFLIKYPFGIMLIGGVGLSELLRNRAEKRWWPTRAQWWLGGVAGGAILLWLLVPGVFGSVVGYAGTHPPDAPLLSLQNFIYYPRSLIVDYSVSRIVGWPVLLGAAYGVWQSKDERLRAWAIFLWVGFVVLIARRALNPRFALNLMPAAFVIAGVLAARLFDLVTRELVRRDLAPKAEGRFNLSFGPLLQVDFEMKVRRVWAESSIGRAIAGLVVALAVAGVGWSAFSGGSRRHATFPLLLALTHRTDGLAAADAEASRQPALAEGQPAMYDYIGSHIADGKKIAVFYGFLEMSEPALRWEAARRQWPSGRPQDVATLGMYFAGDAPEGVEATWAQIVEFDPDYVIVYSDARYGGARLDFNPLSRAMKHDLQLVATAVYTPTIVEDEELMGWLFENRPLTADDIAGQLRGSTKPWPHHVDIFRYEPGAFADDPLPDLFAMLDMPDADRSFVVPKFETPVEADFGGWVKLLGYDLKRDGAAATFTFYWQSERWMPEPYHAFLHLLDSGGTLVAGQDIVPRGNGSYPMEWWKPGEVVSDTLTLDLSALPPGEYSLGTGLYEFNSGARLPVTTPAGDAVADGWLPLTTKFAVP